MAKNISILDNMLSDIKGYASHFLNIKRAGIKNWWAVFLFKYRIVDKVSFKTSSGKIFDIRNQKEYEKFWKEPSLYLHDNYDIKYTKNKVIVNLARDYPRYYNKKQVIFVYDRNEVLGDITRQIRDILYYKEYSFSNPRNRVIVDIGANMGDTAIFFIMRGCKKVYAIEPMPRLYRLMVENLKINRISNVFPINAVCSNSKKKYKLPYGSSWAGDIKEKKEGRSKTVNSITLKELVKKYKIKNALLKIDCEGCEYPIILNSSRELLQNFDEIIMEYHYGYRDLVKKLTDSGFEVSHTLPAKVINPDLAKPIMYIGMIIAKKRNAKL